MLLFLVRHYKNKQHAINMAERSSTSKSAWRVKGDLREGSQYDFLPFDPKNAAQLEALAADPEYEKSGRETVQENLGREAVRRFKTNVTGGVGVVYDEAGQYYIDLGPNNLGKRIPSAEYGRYGLPELARPAPEEEAAKASGDRVSIMAEHPEAFLGTSELKEPDTRIATGEEAVGTLAPHEGHKPEGEARDLQVAAIIDEAKKLAASSEPATESTEGNREVEEALTTTQVEEKPTAGPRESTSFEDVLGTTGGAASRIEESVLKGGLEQVLGTSDQELSLPQGRGGINLAKLNGEEPDKEVAEPAREEVEAEGSPETLADAFDNLVRSIEEIPIEGRESNLRQQLEQLREASQLFQYASPERRRNALGHLMAINEAIAPLLRSYARTTVEEFGRALGAFMSSVPEHRKRGEVSRGLSATLDAFEGPEYREGLATLSTATKKRLNELNIALEDTAWGAGSLQSELENMARGNDELSGTTASRIEALKSAVSAQSSAREDILKLIEDAKATLT